MFTKLSVGWSEGTSLISLAIEKLDTGTYSHVYLKFESDDKPTLIYESHIKGGVQITPYCQLVEAKINGKVKSTHEMVLSVDPEGIKKVWDKCTSLHGDAYDKAQILIYYVWVRFFKRKGTKIVNAFHNKKFTCNELVVTVCKEISSDFRLMDYSYTPNRIFKYFFGK
jgi:hypothetical protein